MAELDDAPMQNRITDFLSEMTSTVQQVETRVRQSVWEPGLRWVLEHGDRYFPLPATVLILISIAFPFWRLKLNAPQYPNGLEATLGVNTVGGDVAEIDGLNHYIGMRPLAEGGEFERSIAVYGIVAMALIASLVMVRRRWFWLAAVPGITFPMVFTADLYFWLHNFGHNLDPTAALSNAFDEFTPTLLGPGRVGQFTTWSFYEAGFGMAFVASVLLLLAVVSRLHRERSQG